MKLSDLVKNLFRKPVNRRTPRKVAPVTAVRRLLGK